MPTICDSAKLADAVGNFARGQPVLVQEPLVRTDPGHVLVGKADAQKTPRRNAFVAQHLGHGAAQAAGQLVLLDRDDRTGLASRLRDDSTVNRLDGVQADDAARGTGVFSGVTSLLNCLAQLVGEGTYRERVAPVRGGSEDRPIIYQAVPGERVEVKGSELWTTAWSADAEHARVFSSPILSRKTAG